MRRLSAAIAGFAATAFFVAPVLAHHSMSMFDTSKEVLIKGKVVRFDWKNPHMYLIVETVGEDGKKLLIQGEGLGITQALVDGLHQKDLPVGAQVVVRANPNRNGPDKTVRLLDVTTPDGEIHPFYNANSKSRTLTPATSLAGNWAPSRQSMSAAWGVIARWPITPEGRAIQKQNKADGLCYVEPTPFLATLDELRTIKIGRNEVVFHFNNTGDDAVRTVRLNAKHAANVKPSRFGDAVGKWEGETLVIDTIAFEPNPSGLFVNIPSSAQKHTIERLTLTDDRRRLRYESTVEDPEYLGKPSSFTMLWDYRPDLKPSPRSEACDQKVAGRYKEY
jgi:Family of unknown function (DUF6152)